MTFISLTRLHLRSRYPLPAFLWHVWRSVRQAKRAPGFIAGNLGRDAAGGFWTVTAWENDDAMRAYRITGAHMRAMPKLLDWCDEASVAHWEQEGDGIPDGPAMQKRMKEIGRLSKVRRPSPLHQSGQTAPSPSPPQMDLSFRPK